MLRTLAVAATLIAIWLGADTWVTRRHPSVGVRPPAATQPNGNPFILPCDSGGEEGEFVVPGKIVLDERFVNPAAPSEDVFRAAIREQLKFSFGNFFESAEGRVTGRYFPSFPPSVIRIVKASSGEYGRALVLDSVGTGATSDYVARALAAGRTETSDPAVIVEYEATIRTAFCRAIAADPKVLLPFDPYLAYWLVPKSKRRLRSWGGERSLTTPCGSAEMAHLRKPSDYWIDWDPLARGKDANGQEFRCEELLVRGEDYGEFPYQLRAMASGKAFVFGEPLRSLPDPLRVSMIFGQLEPWTKPLDTARVQRDLTARPHELAEAARESYRRALSAPLAEDLGYLGFLDFMANLDEVFDVSGAKVSRAADFVTLLVHAKFKVSHRPVVLKIYYGDTLVVGGKGRHHWPFLLNALREADVILHSGHSGMGANLNPEWMARGLGMTDSSLRSLASRKSYQLIASLSCNAYSYFMSEFEALRQDASRPPMTDLMMMASSNYLPLFHLGLLRYIDRLSAGETPSLYGSMRAFAGPSDYFVFKRVEP